MVNKYNIYMDKMYGFCFLTSPVLERGIYITARSFQIMQSNYNF